MKPEILPPIISIHDTVLNSNSISYFQHGYTENASRHFIKFKMLCGDVVNFDFHIPEEYQKIIDKLIGNEPKFGGKSAKKEEKTTKNEVKRLKILPKSEK
jgi:hypothetical protein